MNEKKESSMGKKFNYRRTWSERITSALMGYPDDDETPTRKWFTYRAIVNSICENEDFDQSHKFFNSMSRNILTLIKMGVVERAKKPYAMRDKHPPGQEYLYRWTGKPYIRPIHGSGICKMYPDSYTVEAVDLGMTLYLRYKTHPSWFRRLMR